MNKQILFVIILLITPFTHAQDFELSSGRKAIKTSGDVLFIAAPVACLTTVLVLQDWDGLKQGAFAGVTTLGVSYASKYAVKKERPDGSDNHSFPSFHTATTFTAAGFLQRRYGWQWGVPAYVVAGYVDWSRTYGKKHDWWDVIAGAAIGTGSAFLFTRPFAEKYHLSIAPVTTPEHMGLYASIRF